MKPRLLYVKQAFFEDNQNLLYQTDTFFFYNRDLK